MENVICNCELFDLFKFEKSLVYFIIGFKVNEVMMEWVKCDCIFEMYEEDFELFDDVLIENLQVIEMVFIVSNILISMVGVFVSVINNNVNQVVKVLIVMIILVVILIFVSGFFGMNVEGLFFSDSFYGFWLVMMVVMGIVLLFVFFFYCWKVFQFVVDIFVFRFWRRNFGLGGYMNIVQDKVVEFDYQFIVCGEVFDYSEFGELLIYLYGYGLIILGLECVLDGKQFGDDFEVIVFFEDGYGECNDEVIEEFDCVDFDDDVEEGEIYYMQVVDGMFYFFIVVLVNGDKVCVDFNFLLVGEMLYFKVKVFVVCDVIVQEFEQGYVGEEGEDGQ